MSTEAFVIRELSDLPSGIDSLDAAAQAEGYRMLSVLIGEWTAGTNRFNGPGELLMGAFDGDQVIGIAGLNADPHADGSVRSGRIRRLYVGVGWRGHGVGSGLLATLRHAAEGTFDELAVFTPDESGARFYERCGFEPVAGAPRRSHVQRL